ncbi:hypothetical protein L0F63_003479 [Massospora cicadina]|nr:hypothetical protein L0F63_003479 [Massospora cicadina]
MKWFLIFAAGALAAKCRSGKHDPIHKPIPHLPTASKLSGLTYSPYGANNECLSKETIASQMSNVVKLTDNVRLYGTDCHQLEGVFGAIADKNWPTKVLVGIWTRAGDERFRTELDSVIRVIQNPRFKDHIVGVTVGNEDRFNGVPEERIIANINAVRNQLEQNGIRLPVSTVESYKLWTPAMVNASDVIYANIYPFYTQVYGDGTVRAAVHGALTELRTVMKIIPPGKQIVVAETGWATSGSAPITFGNPSVRTQQEYISTFQCLVATKSKIPCYFLEAYDASWKVGFTVEKHFGILDKSTNALKSNATWQTLFRRCF